MFFISLFVCILGGAFVGSVAWLLIAALSEKSVAPLLSFPIILIYAIPAAVPFGAFAAIVAAILFKALPLANWPFSKRTCIGVGATTGLVIGATFPLFLKVAGFGSEQADGHTINWILAIVGAIAGGWCGTILAVIAWREGHGAK